MARNKRINLARVRLLDALQGRRLQDVYLLSPQVRDQLRWEAERSRKHFRDALLTPEILSHLEDLVEQHLTAARLFFSLNEPPSAAFPIAPPSTKMVLAPSDQETVVIVPGNMFSSLYDIGRHRRLVWFNYLALAGKGICDLKLKPYDGTEQDNAPGVRITARGSFPGLFDILQGYLHLNNFATLLYPYDWRKDVDYETVAKALKTLILELYSSRRRRVHIVAHSLGGLVARRALQCLCEEQGEKKTKKIMGRLVLLAPATSGTLAAALGLAASVSELPGGIMLPPPSKFVQLTTKTWTALYQLLPWDDDLLPSLKHKDHDVRRLGFWRGKIEKRRLYRAFPPNKKPWAAAVNTQFFKERTAVILGCINTPFCQTAGGVHWKFSHNRYRLTRDPDFPVLGDGFMPHRCSVLQDTKAYLASGVDHIRLPMAPCVTTAIVELLNGQVPSCILEYHPGEHSCLEPSLSSGRGAAELSRRP